ncbi:MAG: hypothetical protein OXG33_11180 [Chloroflexi bacterium]|nr:hypothetical protein [Chloroflexota bacterium]
MPRTPRPTLAISITGICTIAVVVLVVGALVIALAACGSAVPAAEAPALIVLEGTTVRLGDVVPDDVIAYYREEMSTAERERLEVPSLDALSDFQVTGPAVMPYYTSNSPAENSEAVRIITDPVEVKRRLTDARAAYPLDDMRRRATEAVINARVPALHIPSGTTVRLGDVFHDELIVYTWERFSPAERESMRQHKGWESIDDFRDIRYTGPALVPAVAGEIPVEPADTDPCGNIIVSKVVVEVPVSGGDDTGPQSPPLPETTASKFGERLVSVPAETVEPCEVPRTPSGAAAIRSKTRSPPPAPNDR